MEPIKLNLQNAVELAEALVAERGADFTYEEHFGPTCRYYNMDGSPSCFIGGILYLKGYRMQDMDRLTHHRFDNLGPVCEMVSKGWIVCDSQTEIFLHELQDSQDGGETWGVALETAKRRVNYQEPTPLQPIPTPVEASK